MFMLEMQMESWRTVDLLMVGNNISSVRVNQDYSTFCSFFEIKIVKV